MRTTMAIDAAGRVVIPKWVRDALHLEAGDLLEVEIHADGITLRPQPVGTPLVQQLGISVYGTNRGQRTEPIPDWIDALREERLREAAGCVRDKPDGC